MTAYEIISIFLGVLSLLIAFGSLLIAIIAFLDRKNKRNVWYICYRKSTHSKVDAA